MRDLLEDLIDMYMSMWHDVTGNMRTWVKYSIGPIIVGAIAIVTTVLIPVALLLVAVLIVDDKVGHVGRRVWKVLRRPFFK